MVKGEKLDSLIDSMTDNVAPRADGLVERLGNSGRRGFDPLPMNDRKILKYFPYFVIICLVIWAVLSLVTYADSIGDLIGILCLVFASGFVILGMVFFPFMERGVFPRWTVFVTALVISEIQWFFGTYWDYLIYSSVMEAVFEFFGIEVTSRTLGAISLLVIFMFTLFTTIGVLTVTVTYLRVYLFQVFRSMQIHAREGVRGKAESFFMVPDIIDVKEIVLEPKERSGSFDVKSMFTMFVYMSVLGLFVSSYIFVNPYFLDVMTWKVMVMLMVMLCLFLPPLIIPWQSVMEMGARAVSDAPRDYRLGEGAKTKMFYTFTAIGVFTMMLMISLYYGFSVERILMNYLQFLIPLILTSAMYAFLYANNFSRVLIDDVYLKFNEWKCGEYGTEGSRRSS